MRRSRKHSEPRGPAIKDRPAFPLEIARWTLLSVFVFREPKSTHPLSSNRDPSYAWCKFDRLLIRSAGVYPCDPPPPGSPPMTKSPIVSAVQEVPPKNTRGKSDVSSMRALDNLLDPHRDAYSSNTEEDDIEIEEALTFLDPEEDDSVDVVEFTEEDDAASEQPATSATAPGLDSPIEALLDDLKGPLRAALKEAYRVLDDEGRVSVWFENQAHRRMVRLAERLADELRATEVKRALTSPPEAE